MADDATRASDPPPERPADSGNDDTVPAGSPPFDDERSAGGGQRGSIDERPTVLPPGKRYKLGAELGRGGMGRVVEAFDLQLGRTVALKEVLASRGGAGIERRFAREVQITARLEHPAIVPLYDSGATEDGRPFYVMRKVTGRPLDELIARSRSVAERMAQLPAVLAAIDAVGHAHRRHVIHRDLKPANILVGELGETVVIDWGLAKVIGEDDGAVEPRLPADGLETQLGSVFGTPGFMAPEQARGEELGPRGDVYALGATLYQLLAGVPPHRGKSATEVLSSTMKDQGPLELDAPGTPPELVAIVRKALAFEAADRYPDAVALGEDVRRFLAGQLVAAHPYTRRERLARIAKKYRGMIAVGAVASVALAGLAWYGVHRILDERDIANDARAVAQRESERAKEQLVAVQDRDERRIVANARALLAANPTAAVAALKQLPPASKYVDEARTVAQSAVARGVAWGQQTVAARPLQALLSPDGRQLFEHTDDAWARLWDLARHKLVWQRREPDLQARALWLGDGKHLILRHPKGPPVLVDVASLDASELPIASMHDGVAAAQGDRILFVDDDGAIHRFDVTAKLDRVLTVERMDKNARLAIAPDGKTGAATDGAKRVIVFDLEGGELARHDGAFHSLEFSGTGKLAAFGAPEVIELALGPPPAWTTVALPLREPHSLALGGYIGDDLQISVGTRVYSWNRVAHERMATGDGFINGFAIAGDLAVVKLSDAKLRFASRYEVGDLQLPTTVASARIYGRPLQNRLVVVGDGLVLDLPLDQFASHALPKELDERPWFVGEDALLYLPSAGDTLRWLELGAMRETVVHLDKPGYHTLESADEDDGRVLISDVFGSVNAGNLEAAPTRLLLLERGLTTARTLAEGPGLWGLLVAGGVVYVEAGKLWGVQGAAPPRELAKLEGAVVTLVRRGALGYAAYTDAGELVEGALDRPTVDKRYGRKAGSAHLATDTDNRVYMSIGTRMYRWDSDLHELADLGKPIRTLLRGAGGMLAGVDGGEFFFLPLASDGTVGAARRVLSAGSTNVALGDRGHLLIAFGQSTELELVELPSRIHWTLPAQIGGTGSVTLSPTGRTLVYDPDAASAYSLVRTLPASPSDLGTWLDELTNATADESGFIVWPWQNP